MIDPSKVEDPFRGGEGGFLGRSCSHPTTSQRFAVLGENLIFRGEAWLLAGQAWSGPTKLVGLRSSLVLPAPSLNLPVQA
jgi:hypothetical protein